MHPKQQGFSLIELSIVLVIIGLTLGAVLGVGNAQIQQTRTSATKQKQEAVKLALINYISRNNRLPCPAIANLQPNAPGYGSESANPGVCTGTIVNGNVATGIVPWISLGISDENATDGFYNRFTYQVSLEATNRTVQTISGLKGAISMHTSTPIAIGANPLGNQSNFCTPAGAIYNPCSAVVVIISHGVNGFGAYSIQGTQKPLSPGADELENTNNNNAFVIKDFSENAANPFDDIVLPLSAIDLMTPLTNNGSIKDYSSKINQDFVSIKNSVIANSVSNRSGLPGAISYPLPNLSPFNRPDPWGTAYRYERFLPSIETTTDPLDPAFAITSNGPDGNIGGNDDIQTTILVSDLQDAFAKVGW